MTLYALTMTIEVFNEELLIETANKHMGECGIEDTVSSASDALVILLDPGGGGAAYDGDLKRAGIQIEDSQVELLTQPVSD